MTDPERPSLPPEGVAAAREAVERMRDGSFDDEALALAVREASKAHRDAAQDSPRA